MAAGLCSLAASAQSMAPAFPQPFQPALPNLPLAQTPALPTLPAALDRVLSLEITVNGAKTGTWPLIDRGGVFYAPQDAFEEWRVTPQTTVPGDNTPLRRPIDFRGIVYWPLSSVPGANATVDSATQSMALNFPPSAFAATRLLREGVTRVVPSPVLTSAFFNYDFNYAASAYRGAPSSRDLGLLGEVGVSNRWGVLTNSFAGRNLTNSQIAQVLGSPRSWTRLETTFTKDFPSDHRSLRLGDSATRAGMLGRNVYFGGVQFGTNFGLTPGYLSQPLPVLSGQSAAPSTVELYVNDVLRQTSIVPTGPFALDNFPALTGNGQARLVVRDLLGRETVIVQSFFTSPQLLAKGLSDWSAEAGRVRRDLGTASARYGPNFASTTWRRGMSNALTLESRAELTPQLRSFGGGVAAVLPWQMLGRAAVAASRESTAGSGAQWLLGIEKQDLRAGASLQAQGASVNFRQLGQDSLVAPTKLQIAANASYAFPGRGAFGVGFASITPHASAAATLGGLPGSGRTAIASANYSVRVFERASVGVSASRVLTGPGGSAIGVTLVLPFEKNTVVTASAQRRDGQNEGYVTASKSPSPDTDFGWRTLAGRQQGSTRAEGGLYYLGRYGRLTGDASAARDQSALRLGASGAVVAAGGELFATRRVDDSYALVEVEGYGDVGVGLGSAPQARTNARGIALVPRLVAYQSNSVRLQAGDLPISAELDSLELSVVPSWRSAVLVKFPVRSGRGALLKVVLADGEPAPAGATVRIEGDAQTFYVARRGEAYVTGLKTANRLQLTWKGQTCGFDAALPEGNREEFPRIGPLRCPGVTR
jgi:outer membrane usher protein